MPRGWAAATAELPTSWEIKGYVADFREFLREFLQEGTFPERKALIRNFVTGIEIVEGQVGSGVNYPHAAERRGVQIGPCR